MAKDKDKNVCATFDCALLGKPQGFPGKPFEIEWV
jgi:hypothetical protein